MDRRYTDKYSIANQQAVTILRKSKNDFRGYKSFQA